MVALSDGLPPSPPGKSEIHDLRDGIIQEDVFRLEVPVNDSNSMDGRNAI